MCFIKIRGQTKRKISGKEKGNLAQKKKREGNPQVCPRCTERASSPDCHLGDKRSKGCHHCALWTKLLGHLLHDKEGINQEK